MRKGLEIRSDGFKKFTFENNKTGEITEKFRTRAELDSYKAGIKKGLKVGRSKMFKYLFKTNGLSQNKMNEYQDFVDKHKKH